MDRATGGSLSFIGEFRHCTNSIIYPEPVVMSGFNTMVSFLGIRNGISSSLHGWNPYKSWQFENCGKQSNDVPRFRDP